jgi:hypothetical protein
MADRRYTPSADGEAGVAAPVNTDPGRSPAASRRQRSEPINAAIFTAFRVDGGEQTPSTTSAICGGSW